MTWPVGERLEIGGSVLCSSALQIMGSAIRATNYEIVLTLNFPMESRFLL